MPHILKMEGRSLAETPSWAVATVVSVMVAFGSFFHGSLKRFGKWLAETKRKSLHAAFEKVKEELMLFGLLSLLLGHWTYFVAKICVKSSLFSNRFYPCLPEDFAKETMSISRVLVSKSEYLNSTNFSEHKHTRSEYFCPKGQESFASYESLEQLHRFLFALGVTHVSYSFITIALAMMKVSFLPPVLVVFFAKQAFLSLPSMPLETPFELSSILSSWFLQIISWRTWENQAKIIADQGTEGSPKAAPPKSLRRVSTFVSHNTSHPWSQHKLLVWLLCFRRQFWSSINRADYMALRLGFISTHELPLSYDFHNYMLRSLEDEFRDIVGISLQYGSLLGTNIYFWLSFLPALLILLMGTKLHHIVVKLAVEILDSCSYSGNHQFKLRDELFWFGRPRLLLWLIQMISFLNAFEMATFIWSLWEVRAPICFMENRSFVVVRLTFGVVTQFWCSFITFPLYVIITQMGSKFKRSLVSEKVRDSLRVWLRRVKDKHNYPPFTLLTAASVTSSESMVDEMERVEAVASCNMEGSSSILGDTSNLHEPASLAQDQAHDQAHEDKEELEIALHSGPIFEVEGDEKLEISFYSGPIFEIDDNGENPTSPTHLQDRPCLHPPS
ncbi:Mlo-related protein [Dillenia turbinata]|uniref:MLO-like protein n=1 Tax=Dillenia turbinata TaxID=194707 RepID=A0AAN8Z157_9MAGN